MLAINIPAFCQPQFEALIDSARVTGNAWQLNIALNMLSEGNKYLADAPDSLLAMYWEMKVQVYGGLGMKPEQYDALNKFYAVKGKTKHQEALGIAMKIRFQIEDSVGYERIKSSVDSVWIDSHGFKDSQKRSLFYSCLNSLMKMDKSDPRTWKLKLELVNHVKGLPLTKNNKADILSTEIQSNFNINPSAENILIAHEALDTLLNDKMYVDAMNIAIMLRAYHEKVGQWEQAYWACRGGALARHNHAKLKIVRASQEMEQIYNVSVAVADQKRQDVITRSFMIGGFVVLISVISYIQQRNKHKALKIVNRKIEVKNRSLEALAIGIEHRLKHPINGLNFLSVRYKKDIVKNEKWEAYGTKVDGYSKELTGMVKDLNEILSKG